MKFKHETETETGCDLCRWSFCNKGRKCENGPNLPLGSLEVFIGGESSPKFTMYRNKY